MPRATLNRSVRITLRPRLGHRRASDPWTLARGALTRLPPTSPSQASNQMKVLVFDPRLVVIVGELSAAWCGSATCLVWGKLGYTGWPGVLHVKCGRAES